jgi:hypothetical protein
MIDRDVHLQLYTLHGRLVVDYSGHVTDEIVRFVSDATIPHSGVMVLRTEKQILYRSLFLFP